MRLFNCLLQQSWFEGLPEARIPYGDEDKIREYFDSSELSKEISPDDFLFVIRKRIYIEWCLEQESKGLKTGEGRDFDYRVYEKFIADETIYELERSTAPEERSDRGVYYGARHRVLEAFVQNAALFLKENQGIDGKDGNHRNLRCDLKPFLERMHQQTAA